MESQHPPTTAGSSSSADAVRLHLIHILVWMTLSALFLVVQRWTFDFEGDSPELEQQIFVVVDCVECMIYGAAIGAMLLFAWRLVSRAQLPVHPGHWLLAATGLIVLVRNGEWVLTQKAIPTLPDGSLGEWNFLRGILSSAEGAVAGSMFILIAVLVRAPSTWRTFFGLLAATAFLRSATMFATFTSDLFDPLWHLQLLVGMLAFCMAGLAIVIDLFRAQRRDFYHWLGVVCYVAEFAVYWGLEIYYRYFYEFDE